MIPSSPGLFEGVDRAAYEAIDAVNQSTLKLVSERTPLHFWQERNHPSDPTKALDFGDAYHTAVLEPDRFAREFVGLPQRIDKRTKKGKELWAEVEAANPGATILRMEEWQTIEKMRDHVWSRRDCRQLLEGAKIEVCVLWNDPDTGVLCKALIDALKPEGWKGWTTVADLKSTTDASLTAFRRSIATYGYHYQMAFYLDGLHALAPDGRLGALIPQEKEAPYAAAVYSVAEDDLDFGRRQYQKDLETVARCMDRDEWPGYPNGIKDCPMPPWKQADYDLKEATYARED